LGTPYYIAPEVLAKNYGPKCDLWSCGVLTYIVLSGMPPFNGSTDQEIMKKVKIGKFTFADPVWNNVSESGKDFITQLLTKDPDQRPSAAQSLNHPWIQEATQQQMEKLDSNAAVSALTNLKSFNAESKLK
jgi:calcium-dependent protein kinase